MYFPAPDPRLRPQPPALAPNLCLPALASDLYLLALAPNWCLPAMVPNLYLPALVPNFVFTVPGPNLYIPILALNVCLPTLAKQKKSFFGPGP